MGPLSAVDPRLSRIFSVILDMVLEVGILQEGCASNSIFRVVLQDISYASCNYPLGPWFFEDGALNQEVLRDVRNSIFLAAYTEVAVSVAVVGHSCVPGS